jgi:hypothetical protein
MNYKTLAQHLERSEAVTERTNEPVRDTLQDGWAKTFVTFRKQGRVVPNVRTVAELDSELTEREKGLVVIASRRASTSELRKRLGEGKATIQNDSLEQAQEDGFDLEDRSIDRAFESIEALQTLFQLYDRMTEKEQEAVFYFVHVWLLKEAGYTISPKMRMKLSRLRKSTGLPLVLEN